MHIKVVDCTVEREIARSAIHQLRRLLSPSGDVVSERGRQLTESVFGAPLTPRQVVDRICEDIQQRGKAALVEYTRKLDGVDLDAAGVRLSQTELVAAHAKADPEFLAVVRRIRQNILTFQNGILSHSATLSMADHELRLEYRPLRRVGVCVPGGAAAYPSTVLMTVVPAQVAGVAEIAVIAPPTPFGANNPDILAVCHELGVREVYRMGGAQGVAALAYGVEGIEPVDKIVGPGNLFVALAKQKVSSFVGIDMLAGPTEVVVLADGSADPEFVAADLLSQAEHAPGASILITWNRELAERTVGALERQLATLERCEQTRESLEKFGAILIVADEASACELSDQIAPEHLQIETDDPQRTFRLIHNAGAVFLGHHTPVAVGDYVAGPSHTLPTSGAARFASGLSANDFLKRMSVIHYSPAKLAEVAKDLRLIAGKEGLTAHSRSVDIRLTGRG